MTRNHHTPAVKVDIIEFRAEYSKDFARINYQWLETFFKIEPQDRVILDNPYETIIKPGGQIFFALINDEVVGTIGLMAKDTETFELVKMGVLPEYKGLKIGKKLVEATIAYSRKLNKRRIFLETNSKLTPALIIYQKAGFKPIDPDPDTKYTRCDLWMELSLD